MESNYNTAAEEHAGKTGRETGKIPMLIAEWEI